MNNNFLDNGLWTPQTTMMRSIQSWVMNTDHHVKSALSIDQNPTLEPLIQRKWPNVKIERAIYPAQNATDLQTFSEDQFDLVYSHQVLEHIPKPWLAAKEIVRVLKPCGIGIHTSCAFNPRHGPPHFQDYYRFLPEGLVELFDDIEVLEKGEWGCREAILYNVGINDGHGNLGGRRFCEAIGTRNDGRYPWVTWIIFRKPFEKRSVPLTGSANEHALQVSSVYGETFSPGVIQKDSHDIAFILKAEEMRYRERLINRACDDDVFSAFMSCLHAGDMVFDVGAHIGRYSVYSARIVGPTGKVYAFEPVTDAYWRLRATLALNRLENVIPIHQAVSDRVGMTEINVFDDPFSSWSSIGYPKMQTPEGILIEPQKKECIETTTLDRFCQKESIERIHFLKIDVEGYEYAVLTGATSLLRDRKIEMICFEISQAPLASSGFSAEQISALLNIHNYTVYAYNMERQKFEHVEGDYSCFHGNFYASYKQL